MKAFLLFLMLGVAALAQGGGAGQVAITSSIPASGPGSGDVVGPASSTNNAFARWSGTTGKLLQDTSDLTYSTPTISVPDAFNISSAGSITETVGGSNKKSTIKNTTGGNFILDQNGGTLPTQVFQGLQLVGKNATQTVFAVDSIGSNSRFIGRRADGTAGSLSAVQSGEAITQIASGGYGATGYSSARASIAFTATENWTDSAAGQKIDLTVVLTGSNTGYSGLQLDGRGRFVSGAGGSKSIPAWGALGAVAAFNDNTGGAITVTDSSTASGTVALATFVSFSGATLAATNASITTTDVFNIYAVAPVQGTNQTITRKHTLGIVDSTSAASSITGGLIVATTLGTTATSVGIGGGNINAGGTVTVGSLTSGRVTYGGTAGLLSDSANLTYTDGTTTGQLIAPVGAVGTPAYTFLGDTDNGPYYIGTNNWGLSAGGTKILDLTATAAALPSAATSGLQFYNTADQVTNYQRTEQLWESSVFKIRNVSAGTLAASGLPIRIESLSQGSNVFTSYQRAGSPMIQTSASSIGSGVFLQGIAASTTWTNTSGTSGALTITPTYNQASGTAANTDLLINRTQTAVGSGAQLLIDAQVATVSQFSVSNVGAMTLSSTAASITGGAGNMTITSGTGASRTLTLRSTTSGSTATTGFVMDATQGITLASLAGTGSRAVLADANGLLSAPVSDERLKEPLRPLPESYGLEAVLALRPSIYKFKDKGRFGDKDYIGFGARATAKVIPEVTGQDRDGTYYLSKEDLTAVLVKAVQQQQVQIGAIEQHPDWIARALGAAALVVAVAAYRRKK